MATEFPQRVRQLFDEALERPEVERLPYVRTACAGDITLFQAVERLLRARVASASFLETDSRGAERIGRYLIRRELGRGAMGVVYDAIDPMIGRNVAVKVIHLESMTGPGAAEFLRERLFREARSAGRLFHPGIAVILDIGQEGNTAFIAMERVDGPTLQQILASGRSLKIGEVLGILQQTAAALDYAHQNGIVHRDIKPANIMLRNGVTVKVADFGIAKIMSVHQTTQTGIVMGTPGYMSPEQIEARPVDGRSDQFSLAVLAYELLTGVRPFEAESLATLAHLIVYGPRPSVREPNPALPPAVDGVFRRALGRLPEERFATCQEFVDALRLAIGPIPEAKTQVSTLDDPRIGERSASRTSRPLRYLIGMVAVAIALALAFVVYKYPYSRAAPISLKVAAAQNPAPHLVLSAAKPSVPPADAPTASDSSAHAPTAASLKVEPKPVPALARSLQIYYAAIAKRRNRRFQDAVALFQQAAELGEPSAMVALGESYQSGEGVAQDEERALHWFRRAANAGNSSGMVFLGAMYLLGDGVAASDEEAARWFQQAANRENPAGIYDLATLYENGQGVPRSLDKAKQLYQRSAALGNREALRRLAQLQNHK